MEEYEHRKALQVHSQLTRVAPPVVGIDKLLTSIDRREQLTHAFLSNGDYRSAYQEAQRAQRSVRHMMRLEWDQAVALAGSPTASPYTLCYYTLPKFWAMQDTIKHSAPGRNLLDTGGFEGPTDAGWTVRQTTLDNVDMHARFSKDKPREGRQCLELYIAAKPNPAEPNKPVKPPEALDRTFLSVTSPAVHAAPGTLVKITGWVRVPKPISASADGALFYDSVGGEPLAVRVGEATDWRQFTLYRKMPATGEITVTLALTGLGAAQFDDIKIEPLLSTTSAPTVLKP
jgi:hypothetical protein